MAKTEYTVSKTGHETETRASKPSAIKLANEWGPGARVRTAAGTVVHEVAGKRKAAAPYTRVDNRELDLGKGVRLPQNFEVAYTYPRTDLALLRKATEDGFDYIVFNLETGERTPVDTTRDARAVAKAAKPKPAQAKAA